MEQIKRFITCNVPVTACNFKCEYCYLNDCKDKRINKLVLEPNKLVSKLNKKRMGGICYFNLCADGETFLQPQLIELVKGLIDEGHYVDIITNGTLSNKFDELVNELNDEQQGHLLIKFSFHYMELKNHDWLDRFVENVNKIRNSKISYTVEITPYDDLIPYIDEIKEFSIKNFGALPHITVARDKDTKDIRILTKLTREEYYKVWSQFDSSLFEFKYSTFNVKRKEFCYAGDWSLFIFLGTGEYRKCYTGEILGNICDDEEILFEACGKCLLPHCFNGHAFLALGCIPSLEAPTYFLERNRVMENGENWVKEPIASFFKSKLYENNEQYSSKKKKECIRETNRYWMKSMKNRIIKKVKREINEKVFKNTKG